MAPGPGEATPSASVLAVNKIDNLISADLFGSGSADRFGYESRLQFCCGVGPFAGGAGNPLNYPVDSITLGNGFSCFSEKSAFGSPCGGFQRHSHAGVSRRQLEILAQPDGDHWSAIRS